MKCLVEGLFAVLVLLVGLQPTFAKENCFGSLQELRKIHKTEHAWHHKTSTGICWHVQSKNSNSVTKVKPNASVPLRTDRVTPEEGRRLRDYLLPFDSFDDRWPR